MNISVEELKKLGQVKRVRQQYKTYISLASKRNRLWAGILQHLDKLTKEDLSTDGQFMVSAALVRKMHRLEAVKDLLRNDFYWRL